MFQKPFYFSLFLSLAMFVLAAPAKASEVQIGTVDITATFIDSQNYSSIVSVSNLTSTPMTFVSYQNLFIPSQIVPIGAAPVTVQPNSTQEVFSCICDVFFSVISLNGNLASLNFSIGGPDFTASALAFTTPGFNATVTQSVPFFIDAAPTPEPASMLLFSVGLVGIVLLLRKSLLA